MIRTALRTFLSPEQAGCNEYTHLRSKCNSFFGRQVVCGRWYVGKDEPGGVPLRGWGYKGYGT
jgi:hypothetical protein